MEPGTRIRIGKRHAEMWGYRTCIGRTAVVVRPVSFTIRREEQHGYSVDLEKSDKYDDGRGWNIHEEDCIPVDIKNNGEAKMLLDKEW